MKKTQLALAAVALVASTAAMADGVTVYGTIDAGIASTSANTSFFGAGNNGATLFGLRGSEDLGNGLKAAFNLEAGLNVSAGQFGANGGVGTALFNRAANISLGTDMATVTLGTVVSPFIVGQLTGANTVGGNGIFVPALYIVNGGSLANVGYRGTGSTAAAAAAQGGFFVPETVNVAVNAGGIGANLQYRVNPSKGTNANVDGNSDYTAANVTASVAGVNLALAYQKVGPTTSGTAVAGQTTTSIAANTEVAGVRLGALYAHNNNDLGNGYMLSASTPIASGLSAVAAYARNSKFTTKSQTSIGLQYDLSKRTYAYVTWNQFSDAIAVVGNDGGRTDASKRAVLIGAGHNF